MTETLITPDIIAREALFQLKNNMIIGNMVHREYVDEFSKVGDTVRIRKPNKFYTVNSATMTLQNVEEDTTSIQITDQNHVAWGFTSKDMTLTVEQFSERYITPAMITIAQSVDASVMGLYADVWNILGTPGTKIADWEGVASVRTRLVENAVPSPYQFAVGPEISQVLAADAKDLNLGSIGQGAWKDSMVGRVAGLQVHETQNTPTHTVGALGGTPLVDGATQNVTYATVIAQSYYGQTIDTKGWSTTVTDVVKKGDVITFAGVYRVNPVPGKGTTAKKVYTELQEFVVMADADSDGSGDAVLQISPPIITSGAQQTVSAAPGDEAAITVKTGTAAASHYQNLAFHRNAFALVMVPLEEPQGAAFTARQAADGISVRVVQDYDMTNDRNNIRLDVLYGYKTIYPELAARRTN